MTNRKKIFYLLENYSKYVDDLLILAGSQVSDRCPFGYLSLIEFRSYTPLFSESNLPCNLIGTDLSFAIFKTRTCLLIFIILLHIQLLGFPAGQGLKKDDFSAFGKVDKTSNGSEKTSNQNTSFAISF